MTNWRERKGMIPQVVVSSRLRVDRNLKGYKFNHIIDDEKYDEIEKKIVDAVNEVFPGQFSHVRLTDLNGQENILMENYLISPDLIKNKEKSSFLISNDQNISFIIGEEDHLRIQILEAGLDLINMEKMASEYLRKLEDKIEFSYNESFGYLTACPTNTGTGLKASAVVHVPVLRNMGLLPAVVDSLGKLGLNIRGMQLSDNEINHDLINIQNQKTIGLSEVEIVLKLKTLIEKLADKEMEMRKNFIEENKDLSSSLMMGADEKLRSSMFISEFDAQTSLSILRTFASLGLYDSLSLDEITELMFKVKKHTINDYNIKNNLDLEEQKARSFFLREYFKGVK